MTYTLTLPAGWETWAPEPMPGSDAARLEGCKCPEEQPWPGSLAINGDCPIHELTAGTKQ